MKLESIHAVVSILTLAGMGGIFTSLATSPAPQGAPLITFNAGEIASAADVNQNFAALEARLTSLEDLLAHFSRSGDNVFVTGANLHIVNGAGVTATENGRGNLIVGYNEMRTDPLFLPNDRTGSHMVVVGSRNNYSSHGGVVVGNNNSTTGAFSSVSGGSGNVASARSASVSGGVENSAAGDFSAVGGGARNMSSGPFSSISGGEGNLADGSHSSITGGTANTAVGASSAISGGAENTASGESSSISGGLRRVATALNSWLAGQPFAASIPVLGPR